MIFDETGWKLVVVAWFRTTFHAFLKGVSNFYRCESLKGWFAHGLYGHSMELSALTVHAV